MSLTPSVLLKPPAPAPHGKEPPGPPPDTPFATVLDDHQARTAVAEGQQSSETSPTSVAERNAHQPTGHDGDRNHKPASDGKQDGRSTGVLAALLSGLPLPAAVASAVVARLPVAPATQEPGVPVPAATTQAKALPLLAADPTVPAVASALPLGPNAKAVPAPTAPSAEAAATLAAVPAGAQPDAPAATPLPSALTAVARALHAPAAPSAPAAATVASASPASATATSPAARAAPGAPASGHAAPQAAAPSVAPNPTSTAAPTPELQATDPASAAESAPGVGLEHAIETVRLALRAAADGGVTHARISLTPRELGSIEVHLRQTADGLVARVVAQHPAAAQLLQQNGGDLRRQLEQSGLNVLRLDIGASGEQGGQAAGRQTLADGGGARRGDAAADDTSAPLDGATETTATATLALPNGALVDVLA